MGDNHDLCCLLNDESRTCSLDLLRVKLSADSAI